MEIISNRRTLLVAGRQISGIKKYPFLTAVADRSVEPLIYLGNGFFFGDEDIVGADVEQIFEELEVAADALLHIIEIELPPSSSRSLAR